MTRMFQRFQVHFLSSIKNKIKNKKGILHKTIKINRTLI
jgi:hypothetical protein